MDTSLGRSPALSVLHSPFHTQPLRLLFCGSKREEWGAPKSGLPVAGRASAGCCHYLSLPIDVPV